MSRSSSTGVRSSQYPNTEGQSLEIETGLSKGSATESTARARGRAICAMRPTAATRDCATRGCPETAAGQGQLSEVATLSASRRARAMRSAPLSPAPATAIPVWAVMWISRPLAVIGSPI